MQGVPAPDLGLAVLQGPWILSLATDIWTPGGGCGAQGAARRSMCVTAYACARSCLCLGRRQGPPRPRHTPCANWCSAPSSRLRGGHIWSQRLEIHCLGLHSILGTPPQLLLIELFDLHTVLACLGGLNKTHPGLYFSRCWRLEGQDQRAGRLVSGELWSFAGAHGHRLCAHVVETEL